MKLVCPNCQRLTKLKVLETRKPDKPNEISRRRRCQECGFTFWTTEARKMEMTVQRPQSKKILKQSSNNVTVKIEIKDLHSTAVQELADAVERILEKYTVN